ncbi:MFS transporter [Mesobaculum littorinae]|nr:MFS transporter [Mesobaculum littorinae]
MAHSRTAVISYAVLATGAFSIGTTEFGSMSLLPPIARSLSLSEPAAGHLISAYALGVLVGAPLISILFSRSPRKPVLIGLMLLVALGNGLSALAAAYPTMMASRFLAGVPHGAYLGMASLVAASLAPEDRRTEAVGYLLLGLTIATIVGVPGATWLGTLAGWRWGFAAVAALALATAAAILVFVPFQRAEASASPLRELGALTLPNVWLTVGIAAIGYGGLFSVYAYLTATLDQVTGVSEVVVPFVVAAFGIGMTIGSLVVPRLADRAQMPTAGATLVWTAVALALYPLAAENVWWISLDVACIGVIMSMTAVLQKRLMDVAGDAQNLAAALNHVAINTANALGPFLAGLALSAGFGLTSTGLVGVALTFAGLVVWAFAWRYDRLHGGPGRHTAPSPEGGLVQARTAMEDLRP